MDVLKELHNLKTEILNSRLIANELKEEVSNKLFEIETELALNYTRCCEELKASDSMTFEDFLTIYFIKTGVKLYKNKKDGYVRNETELYWYYRSLDISL